MATKMKSCKACGAEIAKSAKVCPHCGAKQKGKLGIIAIVVVVIIILAALLGSGDAEESKVDNSGATNASTESTDQTEDGSEDTNVVQIGGSFEDNGLKFTVNSADLNKQINDEYGLYTLPDGQKYIQVDFTFENTGDNDQYVSIYDFDCYADGTLCEQQYVTEETGDFINANLSSGRNVSFSTLYAVPEDASEIELEYTADVWTGEKVFVKLQ